VTGSAIEVAGLVKSYDGRPVVDGVSFSVEAGELVAILGPNGAGKTTTVEIVEGYRRADAGLVRVLGQDPWRADRELRARVGLMLQDGGIDPRARPRETLAQYAAFHDRSLDPDELLGRVGLDGSARTPYRRLSGGERRRLGLALALVGSPEVVVLDEPTSGLDPEGRSDVRAIVADLRAAGVAILLTSHDLTEVERVADRVLVLVDGRIVAAGTAAELAVATAPGIRFRIDGHLTSEEIASLRAALAAGTPHSAVEITAGLAGYRVDGLLPDADTVSRLATWCAAKGRLIVELRTVGGSLEEAYLRLVGDGP
jgi:ABC-2 type transport system ATP-binding protein